jgi:hypothetical protein
MENVQLTIADLASIHSIIDAACSRGAFKAAEMKQVGEIYEKLTAFLQAVKAQADAEAAQQPQGE